jgi:hypothetical protein
MYRNKSLVHETLGTAAIQFITHKWLTCLLMGGRSTLTSKPSRWEWEWLHLTTLSPPCLKWYKVLYFPNLEVLQRALRLLEVN